MNKTTLHFILISACIFLYPKPYISYSKDDINMQTRNTSKISETKQNQEEQNIDLGENTNKNTSYIYVSDEGLAKAINKALGNNGNNSDTVYFLLSDLKTITKLDASNYGIKNIDALRYVVNLTELDLSNNQIEDIQMLQYIPILEKLDLSNNKIKNISVFGSTPRLKALSLSGNPIEDFSILPRLSNLSKLNVSNIKLFTNSFQILTTIKTLKFLNVSNCELSTLDTIENLTELREIYARHNQIKNISPVLKLPTIEVIDLAYNHITDLSPLNSANSSILNNIQAFWLNNQDFISSDTISSDGYVTIVNPFINQWGHPNYNVQASHNGQFDNNEFKWNLTSPGEYNLTLSTVDDIFIGSQKFTYSSTMTYPALVEFIIDVEVPIGINAYMDRTGKLSWNPTIQIKNNGNKMLKLSQIEVNSKNGWQLKHFSKDYQSNMGGVKEFSLRLHGNEILEGNNNLFFDNLYIQPSSFVYLGVEMKMPIQYEAADKLNIADMTIYVEPCI